MGLTALGKKVDRVFILMIALFYFGGILIRQLVSEDKSDILEGPWACAELFRLHHALEQTIISFSCRAK